MAMQLEILLYVKDIFIGFKSFFKQGEPIFKLNKKRNHISCTQ